MFADNPPPSSQCQRSCHPPDSNDHRPNCTVVTPSAFRPQSRIRKKIRNPRRARGESSPQNTVSLSKKAEQHFTLSTNWEDLEPPSSSPFILALLRADQLHHVVVKHQDPPAQWVQLKDRRCLYHQIQSITRTLDSIWLNCCTKATTCARQAI